MVTAKKNIIDIMRESEIVAMPYDRTADTSIPASVRGREIMQNFKQAVRYAKELGAV